MARPNLRRIQYWENHECRVLDVLTLALRRLRDEQGLSLSEDRLNRKLYFFILEAIRELYERGSQWTSYPIYEGNNQPAAEDEDRAAREHKRPDFQFGYIDHQEPNPRQSARQYVVECKRLGNSGRSDWVLNRNYIQHGVVRFRDEDHGYGKSESSGAMIGYLQSMTVQAILRQVNRAAVEDQLPQLTLWREGWMTHDVSRLDQRFRRPVTPSPFALRHLWVDLLRHNSN